MTLFTFVIKWVLRKRAGLTTKPQQTHTIMTSFRPLQKAILTNEQLAAFQNSKAYATITSYVETLNSAVVGVKLTDEHAQSQVRRLAAPSH
jgi:Phosphotyrosyl phosphate activator (PTPA) protein